MEHGRKQFLVWFPALFIACLIFYFSAQPADISTEMSDGVSRLLLSIGRLFGFFEGPAENYYEIIERMSFPVRKGAHVTEYLCLYFAVLFALHRWDLRGKRLFWTAFAMTVAYACTDEFHQLFVPGRAGQVRDVLIDTSGAAAGILLAILIRKIWLKSREKKS